MPTSELRTSGMLQASIIAVVLAVWYRNAQPTDPSAWMLRNTPYPAIGIGCGVLAAVWCVHLAVSLVRAMRPR